MKSVNYHVPKPISSESQKDMSIYMKEYPNEGLTKQHHRLNNATSSFPEKQRQFPIKAGKEKQSQSSSSYMVRVSTKFFVLSAMTTIIVGLVSGMIFSRVFFGQMSSVPLEHNRIIVAPAPVSMMIGNEEEKYGDVVIDAEEEAEEEYEEDSPFPASGSHFYIEIRQADGSFIQSEERLLSAMKNVVEKVSLSLSYSQCTPGLPGSSWKMQCTGIFTTKGHMTFHTWLAPTSLNNVPSNGVILLDFLYSGQDHSRMTDIVIPVLEEEFSIAIPQSELDPVFGWGIKPRHEKDTPGYRNPFFEDLGDWVANPSDMKTKVASVQTPFQRIDIYDFVDMQRNKQDLYIQSLSGDGSYQALNPEFYEPHREVFLDGILQSSNKGNPQYHEALVHPAMFTHSNPGRVAIIGGGEGATLREVLKHKTLKEVLMIEIDEMMVTESAKHLYPNWNGCGEIEGSTDSCFDDPKADVQFQDALAWFINRFNSDEAEAYSADEDSSDDEDEDEDEEDFATEEKFDVIIMDALDPQDNVEFAKTLYRNDVFLKSLFNALNDDGLYIAQLGEASNYDDPAEEETDDKNRAILLNMLSEVGFESVHIYEESHCGFEWPWVFALACKSYDCRAKFFSNPAQIDEAIRRRILQSTSGEPLLKNFDGATMAMYQVPAKNTETTYCRKNPTPVECAFVNSYRTNMPKVSSPNLEVSVKDSDAIPAMMIVEPDDTIHINSHVRDMIVQAAANNMTSMLDLDAVTNFIRSFDVEGSVVRKDNIYLSSGILSLIERTNGTATIEPLGSSLSRDHDGISDAAHPFIYSPFSPAVARHTPLFKSSYVLSLR